MLAMTPCCASAAAKAAAESRSIEERVLRAAEEEREQKAAAARAKRREEDRKRQDVEAKRRSELEAKVRGWSGLPGVVCFSISGSLLCQVSHCWSSCCLHTHSMTESGQHLLAPHLFDIAQELEERPA